MGKAFIWRGRSLETVISSHRLLDFYGIVLLKHYRDTPLDHSKVPEMWKATTAFAGIYDRISEHKASLSARQIVRMETQESACYRRGLMSNDRYHVSRKCGEAH